MPSSIRALVVDDDVISQEIIIRTLRQVGIASEAAFGGWQAEQLLAAQQFDVVVTDLQMANGNGHALCVNLLQRPERPVLIVMTGITDPRLTRDLLVRGVDDVMFKPIDGQLLAAKVQALLERRAAARSPQISRGAFAEGIPRDIDLAISSVPVRRLSPAELDGKIAVLSQLLPISPVASEVASMTSSDETDANTIGRTIKRDPALAAELLKLANSPFYNPSGQTLVEVEKAVVRIGTKRIGELAMATAALGGLTQTRLPWLNVNLTWRRSVAAAIAVDRLCERNDFAANNTGLFLSALMHELGRVVLGAVYADEYKAMLAACTQSGTSLVDQEVRVFPASHADVMARLLAMWKVPAAVYQPLKHAADSFGRLEQLHEPLRTKTELVKIAVLIGRIVVGAWEPWRLVEPPPLAVLARLNLTGVDEMIEQTKADLQAAIAGRRSNVAKQRSPTIAATKARPKALSQIAYLRIGSPRVDFVQEVLRSLGVEPVECPPDDVEIHDRLVINCLGVPPLRLTEYVPRRAAGQRRLIVTDAHRTQEYASLGIPFGLPASYEALRLACRCLTDDEWRQCASADQSQVQAP